MASVSSAKPAALRVLDSPGFASDPRRESLAPEPSLRQRVAITGVSMVGPHGFSLNEAVAAARRGDSGLRPITQFDASTFDCQVAFEVPPQWDEFFPDYTRIRRRERELLSRAAEFAIVASRDAIKDSRAFALDPFTPVYGGVSSNSGTDVEFLFREFPGIHEGKQKEIPKKQLIKTIFTLPAVSLANFLGLRGEAKVDSSACASVFSALNSGRLAIQAGYAESVVVFGADAPINNVTWQLFERADMLTSRDEILVFDRNTEVGTLGEGAASFFLESMESAVDRGAKVYAEIEGFAAGQETGSYMYLAEKTGHRWAETIERALGGNKEIDAVIAHAPGYYYLEEIEILALRHVFGEKLPQIPITAQSASHGQNMAAGSACKMALASYMLSNQELLPTTNCRDVAEYASDLDIVRKPRKHKMRRVLVSGRAFGGTMIAVVLRVPVL